MSDAPPTALLSRRQWLTLGAAVAGGAAIPWLLRWNLPLGQDVGNHAGARALLADTSAPALGPALGPAGADLVMAVFTDYRCGACRVAYPALKAAMRADGRVRSLILDWPVFGDVSRRAAEVALAAGRQGKYGEVHDRLMTDPRTIDDAMLADVVAAAGGDWARVEADLKIHAAAIAARLTRTAEQAMLLGVPGTPAYLIGSTLVIGALEEAEFPGAFREARAG